MQAPVAAQDFFQLIEKSGLLSESQVKKVQDKLGLDRTASAEDTARRLVRERVLTPFQAERLLEGRYRGLVIDRYRIRELLGFGGMGCVFIAEDPEIDRKVAIKVLSTEHSIDAGMLARMKLEAIAGMRLDHPNIIKTYRIDTTGAVHFLVMELVRGISLHELVALHGALKWPMACDIAMQAAEALQSAHQQGIIHRDIKPANFLIEKNGTTRVLDFGLALVSGGGADEFSLSMVFGHDCLGTPDYIAPEQIIDSRNVDARADVYSLGATLYVALTAHVPFPDKNNKAKLEAHRTRKPRNVCELRPEIPPEVGAIVARMMQKDPALRFQSMKDVIQALKPHAKRSNIQFDFRELITLRAKQAKSRAENSGRRSTAPRSSITSPSGWIDASGHHFSEATDAFGKAETPSVRPASVESVRSQPRRPSSETAPIRPISSKDPAPGGWLLESIKGTRKISLVKTRNSIGSGPAANIRINEDGVDAIQCWIEYDGQRWQLRQESKIRPTYVDGSVEAYCALRHGSRLTFGGKTGLRLISIAAKQRNRRLLLKTLIAVAGLALVVALILGTKHYGLW
jgi:serine/threonine protein kinase